MHNEICDQISKDRSQAPGLCTVRFATKGQFLDSSSKDNSHSHLPAPFPWKLGHRTESCRGLVNTPSPFKWFFHTVSIFFLLSFFPSAGFTPSPKDSHERGKGKGKGRIEEGKGKHSKRERKRKGKGKRKEKKKERNRRKTKKERKRKGEGKGGNRKSKGRERKTERKGRGKGEEKEKRTVSQTDHFWYQKLSFSLSFCYRSWILCVRSFFLEMAAIIKKRHYDDKQWNEETKNTTVNSCRTT